MPTEHLIQSTHSEEDLLTKVIWLIRQLLPQTVFWWMEQGDINTLPGGHVVQFLHLCGPWRSEYVKPSLQETQNTSLP